MDGTEILVGRGLVIKVHGTPVSAYILRFWPFICYNKAFIGKSLLSIFGILTESEK